MVSPREWILVGSLALSLGANVWLAQRSSPAPTSPTSAAPGSNAPLPEAANAEGSAGTPPATRSPAASSGRHRPSPQLGSAAGPCAAIEAQLASTEAELDKFLPPAERYARYPREEASEVKIKPFLEAVFTDGGKGRGYSLECHERVCKVDVDRKIARQDWMEAVQSHPMASGLIEHGAYSAEGTYLTLAEKAPEPNEQLMNALYAAVASRMKASEACVATHKEPGMLRVTISLDASAHRLALSLADSLANSPLATCVRPLLDSAIAETKVPADATELSWSFPIEVK